MIEYIGLWLLIAMSINMWALLSVLQSGTSLMRRLIWALLLLVPVLGFLSWFLFGPRVARAT